jgi:SAM-dependent methyltransferase
MSEIQISEQSYIFDYDAVFDVDNYLYFYDDTLAAERTEHQVDVLEKKLSMEAPMRVLDLGCGHGRHANELAARGYSVVGIDRTPGFIEIARRDAAVRGLGAEYAVADMRELDDTEGFDRVICLFDVFGLLRDEENLDVLRRVHRALKPGGGLCIDVRNRDWMVRALLPVTVMQKGEDLMIDRHSFDALSGRLVDQRIFVRNGHVREAPFSVRLYTFSELRFLLSSVGFSLTAALGTWDGAPVGLYQNRMVLFAEKDAAPPAPSI